jgi:hypothetical protein
MALGWANPADGRCSLRGVHDRERERERERERAWIERLGTGTPWHHAREGNGVSPHVSETQL